MTWLDINELDNLFLGSKPLTFFIVNLILTFSVKKGWIYCFKNTSKVNQLLEIKIFKN